MRLWSLHPKYLDPRGLVALWREALLAQRVLQGSTSGYRNHPQLERFRAHPSPLCAIGTYLSGIWREAQERDYSFDRTRIVRASRRPRCDAIAVTVGQLRYEARWLRAKLRARETDGRVPLPAKTAAEAHVIFRAVPGRIASWERPDPTLTDRR